MELLKKHYEKIVLSVMLLLLVVAAGLLPLQVKREQQFLQDLRDSVVATPPKHFQPLDLSTNRGMLLRFRTPTRLELAGMHNLFNPITWKKSRDGGPIKIPPGNEGPGGLVTTNITQLNLTIEFHDITGVGDNPRYRFRVLRETDNTPRATTVSAAANGHNDYFTLLEVKGPPDNPTEFVLRPKGKSRPISVKPGQPFVEPVGFAADLYYPPAKQRFPRQRKKDTIRLEGDPETYKIVSIDPNEVTLSNSKEQRFSVRAEPNQKSQK